MGRPRFMYFVEVRRPGHHMHGTRSMQNTREHAREYKRALADVGVCSVIYRSEIGSGRDLKRIR